MSIRRLCHAGLRLIPAHRITRIAQIRLRAQAMPRPLEGEGRPGAYTPGALFGPELAEAVGGKFLWAGHYTQFDENNSTASAPAG